MDSQHIAVAVTIILAWSGFLIGIIKYLLDRNMASAERIIGLQDEKIAALTAEIRKTNEEMAGLRAELPALYIRKDDCRSSREDWIREISSLEYKMAQANDRILSKIDELAKETYAR